VASETPMPTETYDFGRLSALPDHSAAHPASELLAFHRTIQVDALRMHRAAERGDTTTVGFLAHRVKGASLMFGATEFAEACSLVSMACRSGEVSAMHVAMAAFDDKAHSLSAELAGLAAAGAPAQPSTVPSVSGESEMLCTNLKFLVVEDHDFQRRLIVSFLQRMGAARVEEFGDGAPALAAMTDPAQDADIVILDLSMPGMDGMTLMNQLRPGANRYSIIINSALSPSLLASLVQAARRLNLHLLGVISKPMTQANLAPLVAQHRARQAQPAAPGTP
jgi:CheY-like chemotaxis protein